MRLHSQLHNRDQEHGYPAAQVSLGSLFISPSEPHLCFLLLQASWYCLEFCTNGVTSHALSVPTEEYPWPHHRAFLPRQSQLCESAHTCVQDFQKSLPLHLHTHSSASPHDKTHMSQHLTMSVNLSCSSEIILPTVLFSTVW